MTESKMHTYGPLHNIPHNELHRTFAGIICESDFSTECHYRNKNGSAIAGRILTAWKIDAQNRRNAEIRDNQKQNTTEKGAK